MIMKITLSPSRMDATISVTRSDESLIINGQAFDFSTLPEGATLPSEAIDSEWFAGPVERIGGELHLTLLLPHGPNPPHHMAFPESVQVTGNGPVKLPTVEGIADGN